jgi:hypothetical protein
MGHHRDAEFITTSIVRVLRAGGEMPWQPVRAWLSEAGVDATTSETEAYRRLAGREDMMLEWSLRRIADLSRERGITPVWIYLGLPGAEAEDSVVARSARMAQNAGFEVMSLAGAYGDGPPETLQLASWDRHPNAEGHRRIADRLYNETIANANRLRIPVSGQTQPAAQTPADGTRSGQRSSSGGAIP